MLVVEGNVSEHAGAEWLLNALGQTFPRLRLVWVDGGFSGKDFIQRVFDDTGLHLEVVKRPDAAKGFVLVHRRWVVERTFAWLSNYRRLSKDYELSVYSADSTLYAAMTHLMLRRLAPS